MDLEQIQRWLDDPFVRTGLLLLGGQLVKRLPIITKFVPLVLLALNILVEGITLMFPDAVPPPTKPALYSAIAAASAQGGGWWRFIVDCVLPVLIAVGTHSSIKNVAQGARILDAGMKAAR